MFLACTQSLKSLTTFRSKRAVMAMSEIQRKALNSRVAKSFISCLESQLFPDWRRNEKRVAAAVVVGVSVPHGFIFSSESLLDRERKRERVLELLLCLLVLDFLVPLF